MSIYTVATPGKFGSLSNNWRQLRVSCGVLCTDEVQDPAHGAVPSAGQHPEVRNVSEEVEPGTHTQPHLHVSATETHIPACLIN